MTDAPPAPPAPDVPAAPGRPTAPPGPAPVDPGVELLSDAPVARVADDLLGRLPVAVRLCELACALPLAAPRVVGLVGGAGAGKSSLLNLAAVLLVERGDVAMVTLDGAGHAGATELVEALLQSLQEFFATQNVVDTTDAVRDRLARYGGFVSGVARIAGVKVDLGGALARSAAQVREEIAEMSQEIGKRIVLLVDHVDRLHGRELVATLVALRHLAAIPYVTMVLAYDRRAAALAPDDEVDPRAFERLVQVELAVPPPDRVLLARVLAGGVARLASRLDRDLDPVLPLCDPDCDDGAPLLDLCETPRDAKRAINALSAAAPLWPADVDLRGAALEVALRTLVPELDSPRLDALHRVHATARAVLLAELDASIAGHRLAGAARAALRALCP